MKNKIEVRYGVTLLDMVAVLSVIALLLSLTLVGVQIAREASRKISCSNNFRQIGLGLLNYESAHRCLPRISHTPTGSGPLVAILPFIEQMQLYDSIDFSNGLIIDKTELTTVRIGIYRCPSTLAQERPRTDLCFQTRIVPFCRTQWPMV